MGKLIVNEKLYTVTGDEFWTAKRDPGRPIGKGNEAVHATTAHAIRDVCLTMWGQESDGRGGASKIYPGATATDSRTGERVIDRCMDAIKKDAKSVDLDEADHVWLKGVFEQVGPKIYGANFPRLERAILAVREEKPAKPDKKK